jgi:hypothetical protein
MWALVSMTIFVTACPNGGQGHPETHTPAKPADQHGFDMGPGSGNGGKGVLIDGKPYLLDLVEGGVERNPYVDRKIDVDPELLAGVQKAFTNLPLMPTELIARKLTEISKTRYILALLMLRTMGLFQWKFVILPPEEVNDQRQGVTVGVSQQFQLAKRLQRSIIIDKKMAQRMDPENLTALVFHETAYAFARPIADGKGTFYQDVGAIQEFTAFLFTPPTDEQLNNMFLMMDRIYPENFYQVGHGGIVKDDRLNRIQVNPSIRYKMGKDKLDLDGRTIVTIDDEVSQGLLGNEEFYLKWSKQEICRQIPSAGAALSWEVIRTYIQFDIDFYQRANGQINSFVKFSSFKGNAIDFPTPITQATCNDVVSKLYESARETAVDGFHQN